MAFLGELQQKTEVAEAISEPAPTPAPAADETPDETPAPPADAGGDAAAPPPAPAAEEPPPPVIDEATVAAASTAAAAEAGGDSLKSLLPEAEPTKVRKYTGNAGIEEDILHEAVDLMKEKKWDECLEKLDEIDPEGEIGQMLSFKNTKACALWQGKQDLVGSLVIFEDILLTNPDLESVERNRKQVIMQMKYNDFNAISALLKEKKLNEAEAALRNFSLDEPITPYLRFNAANNLGITLVTIKKKIRNDGKTWYNVIPEAIQYFEVALEEKPDSIEAAHNCGLCLMQCRQFDASLEYFDKALAIKPQLVPALMGKATSLQRLECWNDCIALATGMIEFMGETDFRPWYIRGACHFALKQYEPAVNDLEKAFAIGGVPPDQLFGMQQTLIKSLSKHSEAVLFTNGQADEALALCDRALALQPSIDTPKMLEEKRHAVFNKGLALFAKGQLAESIAVMQAMVDQWPDLKSAREGLGQLALLQEDWKTGIENLEVALAGNPHPSRANLLFDLGVAYFITGDLETAKERFKRVLKKMDPDHDHSIKAIQCIEAIQRGAPQVEGPMFIPGEYNGDKEGYQYSTKGPKGEGYYKDFREQLRALGYSEDLIEILFKTGGVGNPPDMKQLWEAMAPPPDIYNTGGGAHAPGQLAYASPEELQLMYKFLKSPGPFPDEVDPTIREQYLEDEEFEEVMGMTKETFNETPKWKQQKLKEDAGLF